MPRVWMKYDRSQMTFKLDRIAPGVIEAAQGAIEEVMEIDIKPEIEKGGDPVTYPITWDSERQRSAFFASKGFGRGIPTERTGAIEHGFVVTPLGSEFSARAMLHSSMPGTKYVMGDSIGESQSRIHQGRWDIFRTVVMEFATVFKARIDSAIKSKLGGSQ